MNRREALRTLGLDEDATMDDVKTAYKETAQILHPDRFAGKKKLQDRATEQFKNLQEAYAYLTSEKGARESGSSRSSDSSRSGAYSQAEQLEARLAGIAAARVQLVAQRDSLMGQRRNGLILVVVGVAVAIALMRRSDVFFAVGSACAVWGIADLVAATGNIRALDARLKELNNQKKQLEQQLEDLEEE